jgi:hypothetical protein
MAFGVIIKDLWDRRLAVVEDELSPSTDG